MVETNVKGWERNGKRDEGRGTGIEEGKHLRETLSHELIGTIE